MRHALIALAAAATLVLAGCSSPASAPESASETTTAQATQEAAETTPATDYDTPMTAEELEATGDPMDGDHDTEELNNDDFITDGQPTEEEAYAAYDECIADGDTEDYCQVWLDADLMAEEDLQEMGEIINSPGYKCLADLQTTKPELFGGEWFVDAINADPSIVEDPDAAACVELNENL